MPYDSQAFLVVIGVALLCGTAIWLWYLARHSFQARAIILILWLIGLAMSVILGGLYVIIMGAATVMLLLFLWLLLVSSRRWPWWL
ncbi:hypothetical protein JJJ17_07260 [Paracoccus caeni]|uniref:Uncharacterized protein n=1 Tax=Paracoccus caeni TaxID=657651 RepID=A0A934VZW4_9RHOB|nr:hypothetical protein [Paracoccus caeni]MBK4215718.1 hypothetical protein [Paracoccus caeni]